MPWLAVPVALAAVAFIVTPLIGLVRQVPWGDLWDDLPPMTRDTFTVKSGGGGDEDGRDRAKALDLTGVCERIGVPALYVTGTNDRLIPWEQTKHQADATPDGEFVCYPDGNHGAANLPSPSSSNARSPPTTP